MSSETVIKIKNKILMLKASMKSLTGQDIRDVEEDIEMLEDELRSIDLGKENN
jgi:hypothetical protein